MKATDHGSLWDCLIAIPELNVRNPKPERMSHEKEDELVFVFVCDTDTGACFAFAANNGVVRTFTT